MAKTNATRHAHNFKDRTGQVFGRLTVLAFAGMAGESPRRQSTWLCRCECGVEKTMTLTTLAVSNSCGCGRAIALRAKIAGGKQFGDLTVIEFAGMRKQNSFWKCLCKCGKITTVRAAALINGHTQSCGCVHHGNRTHGLSRTGAHNSWMAMRTRCLNPNASCYDDYGGRGITIDPRWSGPECFVNFFADMGPRPLGHTLERKDNNGPYSPNNCIWATRTEQADNRRVARLLTYDELTMSLARWAAHAGMTTSKLRQRIDKLGWTLERAITTP